MHLTLFGSRKMLRRHRQYLKKNLSSAYRFRQQGLKKLLRKIKRFYRVHPHLLALHGKIVYNGSFYSGGYPGWANYLAHSSHNSSLFDSGNHDRVVGSFHALFESSLVAWCNCYHTIGRSHSDCVPLKRDKAHGIESEHLSFSESILQKGTTRGLALSATRTVQHI